VEINSPAKNLSCLDIAPTTSPAVSPLVIGKHEHAMSPGGLAFKVARHGVRKAGPENPKNAR
jgi:hypothetical protein